MQKEIEISGRKIGKNHPVFVVAELSANHCQDLEIAKKTISAMKRSGAGAVKLQTYTPDTLTINSDKEYFKLKTGPWAGMHLYDLYQKAFLPWEWHQELFEFARREGLVCFSTAYDKTAVDFLEKFNTPMHKIASFEITDIPLIEYMARKGKPMMISTGIATAQDIALALDACKRAGNEQIILLKCVSEYPTPAEEVNLRIIPDMEVRFNTLVGLSDHTQGISVPVAAVALGAVVVEKHFILDKSLNSPDKVFSLEPQEFKTMVEAIREVEKSLGSVSYELTEKQKKSRKLARSLFVVRDVKKGEVFTEENVKSIRPGHGLHPRHLKEILGRRAKIVIEAGTPLTWEMIE
ncbi:MAG: pseudaminic acid synthase [Candidatus Heimdallarchaeota archaeon]